jgi:LPS sulfotransferase NodH
MLQKEQLETEWAFYLLLATVNSGDGSTLVMALMASTATRGNPIGPWNRR